MSLNVYDYINENVVKFMAKMRNLLNQNNQFCSTNLPITTKILLMDINDTQALKQHEDLHLEELRVRLKFLNVEIITKSLRLIFDYAIYVIGQGDFTNPIRLYKIIKDLWKCIKINEKYNLIAKESIEEDINNFIIKLMNLVTFNWKNYNLQVSKTLNVSKIKINCFITEYYSQRLLQINLNV